MEKESRNKKTNQINQTKRPQALTFLQAFVAFSLKKKKKATSEMVHPQHDVEWEGRDEEFGKQKWARLSGTDVTATNGP